MLFERGGVIGKVNASGWKWNVVFSNHAQQRQVSRGIREDEIMRDLVKAKIMLRRSCRSAILNHNKNRSIILETDAYFQKLIIITVIDSGRPRLGDIKTVYKVG